MPTAQPVSLYIISYNDADNLRAVLLTVLWADEVAVAVDSFSTDGNGRNHPRIRRMI
jgi:glycosyltransferase involved in cell wall biosynthesis